MKADIKANADGIIAINQEIGDAATESSTATGIYKVIADGDAALAGRLDTVDGKIATLEGASHTHANKALLDTYTQTEADLADAVAKKHEHTNKTVLDGITAEKVAAWDAAEENALDAVDQLTNGAVAANTAAIGVLNGDASKEGSVAKAVADAKSALETEIAKKADITALTAVDERVKAIENDYLTSADKTELTTEINKKVNDADLAAIAKTGNVNDLIQNDGDVIVLDCGNSVA